VIIIIARKSNNKFSIDNETMFVLRKEENVSADDLLRDIKSKNKKFEIDDLQISMRFVNSY
jgi:hypothetical protein